MTKFSRRVAILGVALGLLGMSQAAQASLSLEIDDGVGDSITIHDDGTVTTTGSVTYLLASGTSGSINLVDATVGAFVINNGSASGPPLTSTPSTVTVASNSLDFTTNSNTVGQTLTITEISTGGNFAPPAPAVSMNTQYQPTDIPPLSTTAYNVTASGSGGSAAASGNGGTPVGGVNTNFTPGPATGPFTVTNIVTLTVGGAGTFNESITTTLSSAPEPATLAMVFSALPLLGLAAWRNRRKSA